MKRHSLKVLGDPGRCAPVVRQVAARLAPPLVSSQRHLTYLAFPAPSRALGRRGTRRRRSETFS